MKTVRIVGLVLAFFVAAPATAAKPKAKAEVKATPKTNPSLWGELDAKRVGKWAALKAMARGYLSSLQEKVSKKHPNFAKMLLDSLEALNAARKAAGACWANLRLALARLAAAAARGAGQPLAPIFKPVFAAFDKAPKLIQRGGIDAIVRALNAVKRSLKPGTAKKAVFGAVMWLRRSCNLWVGAGEGSTKKPTLTKAKKK